MVAHLSELVWFSGFALIIAVFGLIVLVLRHRAGNVMPGARAWATVAYVVAVGAPILQLLVAPRSQTILGADTAPSRLGSLIGQAANLIVLVALAAVVLRPGRRVNHHGRLVLVGVWGMAAVLFLAGVLSPMPSTARYLLVFAAALTTVVVGFKDDWRFVGRLAAVTGRVFTFGSLAAAVLDPSWAFIGQAFNTYTQSYLGYDRSIFGIPRLVGIAPHPTVLAIVASTSLAIEVSFRAGRPLARYLSIAAAVVTVVLAQTVTAYIAIGLLLLALLVIRSKAFRGVAALVGVGLLVSLWFAPTALSPDSLTTSDYVTTVSGRTLIWHYATAEWHRHVWLGYGPNMWSGNYLSLNLPPQLQEATNAHNQFFQTLSDSGLVGVAMLVLVLVGLARCVVLAAPVDRGLSAVLAAVVVVNGFTETTLRPVGVVIYPALVTLTLAVTAARSRRQECPDSLSGSPTAERPGKRRAAPAGSAAP